MATLNKEVVYQHVYYVMANSSKKHFNALAISPTVKTNGVIEWSDTSRGAFVIPLEIKADGQPYEKASMRPKTITIILYDGGQVVLEYLTLEIYLKDLQAITEGHPTFKTTQELQQFYLENF